MSTNGTISFESFREQWLEDVRAGNPSTVELGHRFADKLLSQWLDIPDSSTDLIYCDGAGDGGIDIAYLDRGAPSESDSESAPSGDTWYLVQSKYGSAFAGSNTLLEEGRKLIDTLDGKRPRLSSLAGDLLTRLTNFRAAAKEDRDQMVLVFATEDPLTDEQKRTLDDVRAMGRGRLGPIFDVEAASIAAIWTRTQEEPTPVLQQIRVPVKGVLRSSGDELLVGSISLLNLYDFLKSYRTMTNDLDQLYEKNVRRFLGNRGRVNRAMQKTLQEEPERFGLYNNGITIVVADFEQKEDYTIELVEPYVVNGCQTTRTIWEVCHQKLEAGGSGRSQALQDWRSRARQGVVVTKIVKVGMAGEALLQSITKYTNSQNAVREKDFTALGSDFKTWQRQMEDQHHVYLEVQRGGWDSRKAFQHQHPKMPQLHEYANAFDLIKVYGAGWLREAGTAFGRNAAFVPAGTIFRRIMSPEPNDTAFGLDDLYAAYQLQKAADEYKFGRRGPTSRRQTRFLFYMVVLDLLRGVLISANKPHQLKDLTNTLLTVFAPGNEAAATALLETAVKEVIDVYLNSGEEDSVFNEPAYVGRFNNDLNGFLKWDLLGKNEESTPHYSNLIAFTRRAMGRATAGQPSPRDIITKVLTSA